MKLKLVLVTAIFGMVSVYAQDATNRVITTAVPFLSIAADARAAGLGDQGVATSPDAYAQQWNPSKYAFSRKSQGFGVAYTPYLSQLVDDVFLGSFTYFNRNSDRSAFAGSLRYFSLGEIQTQNTLDETPVPQNPLEFTVDATYALRLSERYSMAVTGRFLFSDLRIPDIDGDATAATSFGIDISGYYESEEITYTNFDGRWRAGFNVSNIGPKISYSDADTDSNFIPTNLRLGGGFDFVLDSYNKVSVGLEFAKLLVPTPSDSNGDGVVTRDDDWARESFFSGIFTSFGDAPDGFSEELKEVTWSFGSEYSYDEKFMMRVGYFNESDLKGSRKYATLGAGFVYSAIQVDVSYLFSTSTVRSPLENTLRFGLTFNFGDDYEEY